MGQPYPFSDSADLSGQQLAALIAVNYITVSLYALMLSLSTYNFVKYIVMEGKCGNTPLVLFYALAIALAAARIAVTLFLFHLSSSPIQSMIMAPIVLKLAIGVVEAWIMAELAIRVRFQTRVLSTVQSHPSAIPNLGQESLRVENRIRCGRLSVSLLVLAAVLVFLAFALRADLQPQGRYDAQVHFAIGQQEATQACLILTFVLLTSCLLALLYQLRANQRMQRRDALYRTEARRLLLTLVVFDASYLARIVYDRFVFTDTGLRYSTTLRSLVLNDLAGVIFDFVPVMMLLAFNFCNFRGASDTGAEEGSALESTQRRANRISLMQTLDSQGTFIVLQISNGIEG